MGEELFFPLFWSLTHFAVLTENKKKKVKTREKKARMRKEKAIEKEGKRVQRKKRKTEKKSALSLFLSLSLKAGLWVCKIYTVKVK